MAAYQLAHHDAFGGPNPCSDSENDQASR
jgi:hypothetical protein